jgi:intracellular septation protein
MRLWSFAVEIVPLGVFFAVNAIYGLFAAAGASAAIAAVILIATALSERRIALFPVYSVVLSAAFATTAIALSEKIFIKVQPTVFNGLFAITLLCGLAMGVSVMRAFFGAQFDLTDRTWRLLSLRWGVFFAVLAVGNEIAWRSLSDDGWVAVKVFVFAPLTGLFALSQLPLTLRGRLT